MGFLRRNSITGINVEETIDFEKYSLGNVKLFVQNTIDEIIKTALNDKGLSAEEFEKRENKKKRLQAALKECMYGSVQDKQFVKEFILDLLIKTYNVNDTNLDYVIPFNKPKYLTTQDKFDILLYVYKREHGKVALHQLIRKYDLDRLKTIDGMTYYCITAEEIEDIYNEENPQLYFEDKLEIVVQRVYSLYKGYGCMDDILDMQTDGISGGVNGLPESFILDHSREFEMYLNQMKTTKVPRSYDSVWLFYAGKSVHMSFMSFGSYDELQRICQNIYKFGSPGQLSKLNGYKVNKLKDGSRVVVLRPDFCESWAFFVRKFEVPDVSLKALITDNNADVVIKFIEFLVKGSRNIAVTGAQGTGKTTLLNAMLEHVYNMYTLRILEMAFELHVRKRFPRRNIVTIQETDNVSGQEGLDILKKTDGVVTIVGEVASDPVAAYMIQTAQVASKFTIFSHHAKTFKDLVMALRNSLLKTGMFSNESIAEEQIIRVLNFDIHLEKDIYGKRYIERITECIPLEGVEYPTGFRSASSVEEKLNSFMETTLAFYRKMTGRKIYTYRNIVEFDINNNQYVISNPLSDETIKEMSKEMTREDRQEFKSFIKSLGMK